MKLLYLLPLLLLGCTKDEELLILPRSGADLIFSPQEPCIEEVITITFDNGFSNNCGSSKIEVMLPDGWVTLADRTPVDGLVHTTWTTGQTGDHQFRGSWRKKGGCSGHNTKVIESITVNDNCCQNYFLSRSVCGSICQYGVEFWLMVDQDVYAYMTGILPPEADLCGYYDENNNLVVPMSGNEFYIEGDLYGCQANHFFVYFNSPFPPTSTWSVRYEGGSMTTSPIPCIQ